MVFFSFLVGFSAPFFFLFLIAFEVARCPVGSGAIHGNGKRAILDDEDELDDGRVATPAEELDLKDGRSASDDGRENGRAIDDEEELDDGRAIMADDEAALDDGRAINPEDEEWQLDDGRASRGLDSKAITLDPMDVIHPGVGLISGS